MDWSFTTGCLKSTVQKCSFAYRVYIYSLLILCFYSPYGYELIWFLYKRVKEIIYGGKCLGQGLALE